MTLCQIHIYTHSVTFCFMFMFSWKTAQYMTYSQSDVSTDVRIQRYIFSMMNDIRAHNGSLRIWFELFLPLEMQVDTLWWLVRDTIIQCDFVLDYSVLEQIIVKTDCESQIIAFCSFVMHFVSKSGFIFIRNSPSSIRKKQDCINSVSIGHLCCRCWTLSVRMSIYWCWALRTLSL